MFSSEYRILGNRVDPLDYHSAVQRICEWASQGESRYVCAANVHMMMEAYDSPEFRHVLSTADLVTPDGMPLVWGLRLLGSRDQPRVYGPELTLRVCGAAARQRLRVGLFGGSPASLADFSRFLSTHFPDLEVGLQIAPPFRPLTVEEDECYLRQMIDANIRVLLVGIGCPKQERWMFDHKGRLPAVMIGVGAAFDFYSGRVKQAPSFLQRLGLEWAFRLAVEPRRLWKRYLKHNPRFVVLFLMQLLGIRRFQEDWK